jgi:RNA polymerase sigma-70 factor, ECF subfamily
MGRSVAEDASELTTVFEAIGPQLRRFLVGVTKDVHAAEDAAQAAFARALEKRPTGPPEALKGWFFKVALHEALANRRIEERGKAAVRDLRWLREMDATWAELRIETQETAARVQDGIERLPGEQQVVIRKRLQDEKTFAQIASEEGLPLGTVLTRMRLALQRLRNMLRDET